MKRIVVEGESKSEILIGELFTNVSKYIPSENVVIITDDNLYKHYSTQFPNFPIVRIATGEKNKNLSAVEKLINQLIELEVDRHSFLLGIGGGLVSDITGFVASVYMRGIDFGFVSTSLLSQVDASVGGKNGVNFNSYKNIIGNFNQPKFVICDYQMFSTLPQKELLSGMAEVLKYAIIYDKKMFRFIADNIQKILNKDEAVLSELIYKSISIKAEIVANDEKEQGDRKKLNFGHTFGHAIEKYDTISHGEAISIGMLFSAHLSWQRGLLNQSELEDIKKVLLDLGLPVFTNIDKLKIAEAITKDKKRNKKNIDFVLINGIGKSLVKSISIDELKESIMAYDYK